MITTENVYCNAIEDEENAHIIKPKIYRVKEMCIKSINPHLVIWKKLKLRSKENHSPDSEPLPITQELLNIALGKTTTPFFLFLALAGAVHPHLQRYQQFPLFISLPYWLALPVLSNIVIFEWQGSAWDKTHHNWTSAGPLRHGTYR